MSAFRDRLIEEVKRYPVLYDTRHENHRDIDVRDRCWAEISEKLNENAEVLKREWKSLRDSLRQAMKKPSKAVSGAPAKKWRYQSKMAFVIPFMTARPKQKRFRDEEIKLDDTEIASDQELDVWEPPAVAAQSDNDAMDLFFASVCQSTKRLPKKYQNQVKRQVLDVLLKAEEESECDNGETKTEMYNQY